MGYGELIKNFNRIREYMREFYVYGFKSREEYTRKSARSYDDERRRLESWLGDYMRFRQTSDGKTVFLSVDSRTSRHNPLYKAWKAKSFTDGDITLHFILFDILHSPDISLTLGEITERMDIYLQSFREPKMFDSTTVRKKLNEYISEGILLAEKRGKTAVYRRAEAVTLPHGDALHFLSETAPCGVIGSYLLDRKGSHEDAVSFKHHYITGAMDSEIVCSLLLAMSERRYVRLEIINRHKDRTTENQVIPLRLYNSVQNGRQYLMAYSPRFRRITSFRADNILSVKSLGVCEDFERYRKMLGRIEPHIWGVSTQCGTKEMQHVEFTVQYGNDEEHIHKRLEREKRIGTVERPDAHTSRFSADVFDIGEMIPWTFPM